MLAKDIGHPGKAPLELPGGPSGGADHPRGISEGGRSARAGGVEHDDGTRVRSAAPEVRTCGASSRHRALDDVRGRTTAAVEHVVRHQEARNARGDASVSRLVRSPRAA